MNKDLTRCILCLSIALSVAACASKPKPYAVLPLANKEVFSADGQSFAMRYVPAGLRFPSGSDDAGSAAAEKAYWLAETETTQGLWNTVTAWAKTQGYSFSFDTQNKTEEHAAPETPVNNVNWRDCIVFCNALTEWYNASAKPALALVPVYYSDKRFKTVLKTATDSPMPESLAKGSEDNPYVMEAADGFRLPSMHEWELAARLTDGEENTVQGAAIQLDGKTWYFTKGDSASGAKLAAYYIPDDSKKTDDKLAARKIENDRVSIYNWYWDKTSWAYTKINDAAPVSTKEANALGIYDMSGNIWEWCFDTHPEHGTARIVRGGGWYNSADFIIIGYVSYDFPDAHNLLLGFRLARTAYEQEKKR